MTKFIIDPLHSSIGFKIKHLMISTVNGNFNKFNATMQSPVPIKFDGASIQFEADVDSITTNITDRDNHLKSADFFDAAKFPKLTFKSTNVESSGSHYTVTGDLTIRDVTKPVSLKGTFNGTDVDAYGQTKYGFEIEGQIKRSDFNLNFNIAGGKGSMLIGDDVILMIDVQMMELNEA
jgi:hypothetical protein